MVCIVGSGLSVSILLICLSVSMPATLLTGCLGVPSDLAGHGETEKQCTAGLQVIPEAGLTPVTALVAIHMPGSNLFTTGLPTSSPVKTACMRLWLVLTS